MPVGAAEATGGGEKLDRIETEHGVARFVGVECPGEAGQDHTIAVVELPALPSLLQAGGAIVLQQQPVLGMLAGLEQQRRSHAGGEGKGAELLGAVEVPPAVAGSLGF